MISYKQSANTMEITNNTMGRHSKIKTWESNGVNTIYIYFKFLFCLRPALKW